jgi:hypothetical protein
VFFNTTKLINKISSFRLNNQQQEKFINKSVSAMASKEPQSVKIFPVKYYFIRVVGEDAETTQRLLLRSYKPSQEVYVENGPGVRECHCVCEKWNGTFTPSADAKFFFKMPNRLKGFIEESIKTGVCQDAFHEPDIVEYFGSFTKTRNLTAPTSFFKAIKFV